MFDRRKSKGTSFAVLGANLFLLLLALLLLSLSGSKTPKTPVVKKPFRPDPVESPPSVEPEIPDPPEIDLHPNVLRYSASGYVNLDPANCSVTNSNDERLVLALLECLTVLDPTTGRAAPAAADSWSVASDGRTWTFHLREDAKWSDGSPVTSADFVRSWTRTLYSMTESPWRFLFRPIEGCSTILDDGAKSKALGRLRRALKRLKDANKAEAAIPGAEINEAVDELGVRPYLRGFMSEAVRGLAKLGKDDLYPHEWIDPARAELKVMSQKYKSSSRKAFGEFGKTLGVIAKDTHTLQIKTAWYFPALPELLARGSLGPLHESYSDKRSQAFDPGEYVSNGPYKLVNRGARKRNGTEDRILSIVHIEANEDYNGPWKGTLTKIECSTDQRAPNDLFEFNEKALDWVLCDWLEYPTTGSRKKPESNLRKTIEDTAGFKVSPVPTVVYLRFRCDRAPFDKRDAREAFARLIDRKGIAKQYWPAARVADRIVPPGVRGRSGRSGSVTMPTADEAKAKSLFKKLGFDSDTWIEIAFDEAAGNNEAVSYCISGWKKNFKVDPGDRMVASKELQGVLRSGQYYCMLTSDRGHVNEAFSYLGGFHSKNADSGLGWYDDVFDALIDGARDPDAAAAEGAAYLERIGMPELEVVLELAKYHAKDKDELRGRLLAAAEQRLMDEFVIVPLVYLNEAELSRRFQSGTSDKARKNPAFASYYLPAMGK